MPGVSDNIRVVSIVDRFLEHSRIFFFGNNGDPQVYIGSADWMDPQPEPARGGWSFPIEAAGLAEKRLIEEILAMSMADNAKARALLADGTRIGRLPVGHRQASARVRSQERLLEIAADARTPARMKDVQPVPEVDPRAQPDRTTRRGSGETKLRQASCLSPLVFGHFRLHETPNATPPNDRCYLSVTFDGGSITFGITGAAAATGGAAWTGASPPGPT